MNNKRKTQYRSYSIRGNNTTGYILTVRNPGESRIIDVFPTLEDAQAVGKAYAGREDTN